MDIFDVVINDNIKKELIKFPKYIVKKLLTWVKAVEETGLREVQKLPGYHDEPLKGKRKGQRSIRLNHAYRAIYIIRADALDKSFQEIEFVYIEEVSKHDY
jgi:toxin HigB-1